MRIKPGDKVNELPEIVSTALRGADTAGSCTIRHSEYDVDEDTGGMDDVKQDATSTMSMRIPAAWMIASKTQRVRCR